MTGTMKIMGVTGHETVTWDTEVQETVDTAARQFAELLLSGHRGFVRTGDGMEMVDTFDPQAEEMVVIIPLVGG